MKKKNPSSVQRPGIPGQTYHPDRVRSLMVVIKGEMELLRGREVSYEELGRWVGQAGSTAFDKFQKPQQPQVEALLGWLERLPETTRNRVLNACCRTFPTLGSARLIHDPAQISNLKSLLRQANGFAIIQGGSETARTFLAAALGHESANLEGARRPVCGIDAHEPDWFVPLENVLYLNNLLEPTRLRESVHRAWPIVARAKHCLVVLNGIWAAAEGLHGEVIEMATHSLVFLVEDFRSKPDDLARRAPRPSHVITVTDDSNTRIRVAIQTF